MKTTRIDISSTKARATIFRSGTDIVINVTPLVGQGGSLVVNARDALERQRVARLLQRQMDGCRGTAGDVAEYERVIETFAD